MLQALNVVALCFATPQRAAPFPHQYVVVITLNLVQAEQAFRCEICSRHSCPALRWIEETPAAMSSVFHQPESPKAPTRFASAQKGGALLRRQYSCRRKFAHLWKSITKILIARYKHVSLAVVMRPESLHIAKAIPPRPCRGIGNVSHSQSHFFRVRLPTRIAIWKQDAKYAVFTGHLCVGCIDAVIEKT